MNDLKFCKDCKHAIPAKIAKPWAKFFGKKDTVDGYSYCGISGDTPLVSFNIVTGEKYTPELRTCLSFRNHETACGKDAKFFEAKP